MVKVRKIELDELHLVVDVINHMPEFEFIFYKAQLNRRLASPDSILLIAEFAGKPIGCVLAFNKHFDGAIYCWQGCVLPPYRRMGIGSTLFIALENEANKKLFSEITIVVKCREIHLLQFVLKQGFIIVGYNDNAVDSEVELSMKL